MGRIRTAFMSLLAFAGIAVMLDPGAALAQRCEPWAGKVVSAQGTVEVKLAGETGWQPVRLNETYCPGDTIRTDRRSRAAIALSNHPVLRLDETSTVTLGGMKDERASLVDLISGAAYFFSRVARNLEVRTASVNAGVEGTEFLIRADEDQTALTIFEGRVLAANEAGSLIVTDGQSAVARPGQAPQPVLVVRPREAVRWAIYYPPIVAYRPAAFAGQPEGAWQTHVQRSLEAYRTGNLAQAFSALEGAPEDVDDPRFYTYRGALLLTVGRVEEAQAEIGRGLDLSPGNAEALALQSVVAVAQNEQERALDLGQKAVAADPNSATAKIALSYAQQARFDLEGALKSVQEAVRLDPENALAWARLAELRQSFGELDKSLDAARKAVSLNPDLERTQTVLGFAYLTQVKTREARQAFEKAIALDGAAPLPRLGLGLARIRESDLEEGRRELEIAVSLDPDNALVRSYLGKAYYEEKREALAAKQFGMAKELDPNDPTAFFYDAILKQTTNRPVEALRDFQKAIELNDNRAVYRSRLLLDRDLAARSASMARIYSDLGFQQLALVEGWKSVNADPSNYSAHRFLADSYAALPRHEIARVSELLQSQLLQPINITPIQPRLAESNLFVISGGGASDLSFNEFNPLFNRNQLALLLNGLAGSNSTFSDEVVVSGVYKNSSFSLGQYYFTTDGFRENSDLTDRIYNAFVQYNPFPQTSIQAEYRHRENDRGDVELLFWRDNIADRDFYKEDQDTIRVGFRHSFSPSSTLIGNFMYNEKDEKFLNLFLFDPRIIGGPAPPPFLEDFTNVDTKDKAISTELQYLFNSKYINVVAGIGYFNIDQDINIVENVIFPSDPPLFIGSFPDDIDLDIDHPNIYIYSYLKPTNTLTFTIGASGDFFDADGKGGTQRDLKRDQFNPKLGVTWNPFPNTTVRGAIFRTLKRTLITDQTLEPTQVAGFNQFFDEENAIRAWVYGAAVDQKFLTSLYGGAEFNYRDLEVPFFGQMSPADPFEFLKTDWKEYRGRAYLFWTPLNYLALGGEYLYEKFDRTEEYSAGIMQVKTHTVPLRMNFFHPSGFIAGFKATYIDQEGEFIRKEILTFEKGQSEFWVVDGALSYRLPNRHGFVTVGVSNLFDEKFDFADTDPANPRIQPDRTIFGRLTLAFP